MRSSADPRVSRPLSPCLPGSRLPDCCLAAVHRDSYAVRSASTFRSWPCDLFLCPLLTSGEASRCLSTPVAGRHRARPPRVLSRHFHTYCLSDLRTGVPCKYRASRNVACSPRWVASYPLPVRQASALPSGSLQTRSPRNPCRACRGLSPPSRCALPGGPTKKRAPKRPQMQPHSLAFEG